MALYLLPPSPETFQLKDGYTHENGSDGCKQRPLYFLCVRAKLAAHRKGARAMFGGVRIERRRKKGFSLSGLTLRALIHYVLSHARTHARMMTSFP